MGIRITCPNGHKLNVKESQAGRRGICPHCGAKFAIPAQDETAPSTAEYPTATPPPEVTAEPDTPMDEAIWYVRLPTGDQYGPVSAEALDEWVEQGRVTADSLVWRDGWQDWAPAGEVLTHWSAKTKEEKIDEKIIVEPPQDAVDELPGETFPKVDLPAPIVTAPTRSVVHMRRHRSHRSTQLVVWLAAVVVLLGIAFVWVLFYR